MLIVNHFLCVGSRILLNFLFEKFMKLSEERFIQGQMIEVLVDVVKILSGQYFTMSSAIYMIILTMKFLMVLF